MTVIMPSTAITTQTVVIKTDIEVAHPTIVCPITAVLTPTAVFISLSADYKTISVDATQIAKPADYGTYSYVLTVNSSNF